jgi:hypothetical protein
MNLSDRQFNVLVGAICSIIGAIFGINIWYNGINTMEQMTF